MIEAILDMAPRWALLHAPALLIMVPLFLAPLLAILPSGRLSWLISIFATVFALFCAMILVGQVQASPVG
ncbi:MAG TPA: cation:proton antiporter, partial [Hyphomonas atlantica]|nr:cation:proton antiporter [Hyphomonas atlantica]